MTFKIMVAHPIIAFLVRFTGRLVDTSGFKVGPDAGAIFETNIYPPIL